MAGSELQLRIRERTNSFDADGEVAWSWPPGAEVKLVMCLARMAGDGGKTAGPQGDRV
ncbi:hypothetical protein BRAO285_20009 [Bradyrhizobium sp. ORS 285]|nr:hypothetical protein BRAO285_20009 [Bradyrhizobium sp. ORS 285]